MRLQNLLGHASIYVPKLGVRGWLARLLTIIILGVCAGAVSSASAQRTDIYVKPQPPRPRPPVCQPVPVYIRNLRYDDYSRYTSLSRTSVPLGGFFQIRGNCLQYNGRVVVTIQDVTRGTGPGVTAFQLTNVTVSGNVVTAQAPNLPIFQNRTYHVAVFVYGPQPFKTANPGQLTIR